MVIGPTPPGTGVMAEATFFACITHSVGATEGKQCGKHRKGSRREGRWVNSTGSNPDHVTHGFIVHIAHQALA